VGGRPVIARIKKALRDWSGPLTSDSPELKNLFSGPKASAGVLVNEHTALNYSAFWAAISLISGDVASLPLIYYKRLPKGGKERYHEHPNYKILHDEPNPEMSSFVFRETMQAHVLSWGNAYAEIERTAAGHPLHLWPITPDRVEVLRDSSGLLYRVRGQKGAQGVVIPARDMLHIPGLGWDGTVGYSVVEKARESLGLGIATERFGGSFFGNGSVFGGVLTHPQRLGDEGLKNLRESVNARHTGVENSHRFMILEEGVSYTQLGVKPNDAQFLETRKFQITEIARWFNLPVHKLREMDNSSVRANIEQEARDYIGSTLRRWLVRWEQEIVRKLISPRERNIQFAEHLVDGMLRGDTAARHAAYAHGRQWGYYSVDDIREWENLNPLPDGAGKIYLVPANMTPANRIDEVIDAQVREPEPAPAPEPAESSDAERKLLAAQVEAQSETIRSFGDRLEAAGQREAEQAAVAATLRQELSQAQDAQREAGEQREAAEGKLTATLLELASATLDRDNALQLVKDVQADLALQHERGVELDARVASLTADLEQRQLEIEAVRLNLATSMQETEAAVLAFRSVERDMAAQGDNAREMIRAREGWLEALAWEGEAHAATIRSLSDRAEGLAQQVAARDADLDAAKQERETRLAAVQTAEAASEAARKALAEAESRAKDAVEAHEAIAAEVRAELALSDRALVEANSLIATHVAALATQGAVIEAANAAQAQAVKAQADAETRAAAAAEVSEAHIAQAVAATNAADEAARALKQQKDAEAERLTAMLTVQRSMASEVVRKLVDVEATRARRNQADKHKLRSWMDLYYATSEDVFYDALLPIARLHAACVGAPDPETQARELARAHVAESVTQLSGVLESADFHETLDRVLRRWEAVRHEATADKLLRDGIASVRAL
jgi:HK97 family phage portal protein